MISFAKEKGSKALSVVKLLAIIIFKWQSRRNLNRVDETYFKLPKNGVSDLQNISLQGLMLLNDVGLAKAIKIKNPYKSPPASKLLLS